MKRIALLALVLWSLLALPVLSPGEAWGARSLDPEEAWGALSSPAEAWGA